MTELQLRLWCLWMCEEFAGMDYWMDAVEAASEGGSPAMSDLLCGICGEVNPLTAWKLLERMP